MAACRWSRCLAGEPGRDGAGGINAGEQAGDLTAGDDPASAMQGGPPWNSEYLRQNRRIGDYAP
ncbi:hypothetical protein NSPZN2_30210 [Nitrospira defluvii]|uniref:Uncharacterized protein n=1 Tax=Nitrospira defluvii TaxID=330214 RepID=A0ABM8RGH1_9BACT|nr:hypothetical protein NSPZN2_30210 [Nitrospira defluvii]